MWDKVTTGLRSVHIRLRDNKDELVWILNGASGNYIVRIEYATIYEVEQDEEKWWWYKLWKVKPPPIQITNVVDS